MTDRIEMDVFIRRNEDGVVRSYRTTDTSDLAVLDYGWSEGNFGCDCNRGLLFARANGEEDPDHKCSHDRYKVWIKRADSDEVIYSDDLPPVY